MLEDELLTPKQAGKMLGLKSDTLYRAAIRGDIPCVKVLVGKRRDTIRFRRSDLEAHLQRINAPRGVAK